jgi:predicted dehydrogenase
VNPVRVGVWGVGAWGEKHARVYAAIPEAELAGVFDANADRARAVAAQHGGRAFSSAAALLRECEAVSIAVPTVEHRAALEEAAAAGRHALVEKPLAPTVEDADAMLAAARRARITLQVGQVERFNPALLAAREHIRDVKFVESHRLALFQPRSLDIDVVFDLMIHDLDAVLHCLGRAPQSVSAVGVAVLSENEDIANARLEFEDGCVANLTASRVSQDRLRRIRFFQSDAYLSIDLFEKKVDVLRVGPAGADPAQIRAMLARLRGAALGTPGAAAAAAAAGALASGSSAGAMPFARERLEVGGGEPLTLELQAFLKSLRGEGEGAASAEAGRSALAVAAQVRAAMKERARRWEARASAAS